MPTPCGGSNQFTGPFILRRMKSEVLRELPPKTEDVRRVELETEQRKLYLAAVVDAREKLRAAKPEDKMTVFAVLMRLREICCDPRLVADDWARAAAPSWRPVWSLSPRRWRAGTAFCCSASSPPCWSCWQSGWTRPG